MAITAVRSTAAHNAIQYDSYAHQQEQISQACKAHNTSIKRKSDYISEKRKMSAFLYKGIAKDLAPVQSIYKFSFAGFTKEGGPDEHTKTIGRNDGKIQERS